MPCSVCRNMSDEIVVLREELKRLRNENDRLKARLVEATIPKPPPFRGGDLRATIGELIDCPSLPSRRS